MKNMEQRYTENIESMRRELKRRQQQEEISGVQVKQLWRKLRNLKMTLIMANWKIFVPEIAPSMKKTRND